MTADSNIINFKKIGLTVLLQAFGITLMHVLFESRHDTPFSLERLALFFFGYGVLMFIALVLIRLYEVKKSAKTRE